jgi:hypothetical protein
MTKKDSSKVTIPECLHPMGKAFEQPREDGSGRIDMICGSCGITMCEVVNPPRQVDDSSASEVAKQEEPVKCANRQCASNVPTRDGCGLGADDRFGKPVEKCSDFRPTNLANNSCDHPKKLQRTAQDGTVICGVCTATLKTAEEFKEALSAARDKRQALFDKHPEVVSVSTGTDFFQNTREDDESVCTKTNCSQYCAEEPNGCEEYAYVEECDQAILQNSTQGGDHAAAQTEEAAEGVEEGERATGCGTGIVADAEIAVCIGCGCDDNHACEGIFLDPCHWLRVDRTTGKGVCSECAGKLEEWDALYQGNPGGGLKEALVEHHNSKQSTSYVTRDPDKIGGRFQELLPVPVDDHELGQLGSELAEKHSLWLKTRLDAKKFAKACKEVTDRCEDEMEELGLIIQDQARLAPVDCQWEFDFSAGVKKLRRCDTWTIEREETLSAEERFGKQAELFDQVQQSEASVEQLREVQAGEGLADQPGPASLCISCVGDCGVFHPSSVLMSCPGHRAELSQEQIKHRDTVCCGDNGWRPCELSDKCFGPGNEEGPSDCLVELFKKGPVDPLCAACHTSSDCDDCCKTCSDQCKASQFCRRDSAAEETEQPQVDQNALTFAELLGLGYSRNAAKILLAGFSLVHYDRDAKCIHTSAPDLRDDWFMFEPFDTYAAAERALKEMLEDPGVIQIGMDAKGAVTGNQKHLTAKGFEFYRLFNERKEFGANEPCRIKKGPNWTTFMKAADTEVILAAWEDLLNNDMNALED